MKPTVRLRDVIEADLPALFDHQSDPEASKMAAFPARDWDAFVAHETKIAQDATVVRKTILADEQVAGSIGSFDQGGLRLVGYVIGRSDWGKGIATLALAQFLDLVTTRPLHAFVAKHNVGSVRVLEKNGFTVVREQTSHEHGMVVDELLLRLAPEGNLVDRAIARDPEAVRALVKEVGPRVHDRVVKALMRPEERHDIAREVDDLSHEVFLALFDDDARELRAWSPEKGSLDAFVAAITDQVLSKIEERAHEPAGEDEEEQKEAAVRPEGAPAFDATAEDRIATRLLAKPKKATPKTAEARSPKVVRPHRWLTTVTPIVALAAGVALFVAVRGPRGRPLPAYALSVVSASQPRAPSSVANAPEYTVDPDGDLEIVARPAVPLSGLLAEGIVVRAGEAKPWIVPIEISSDGALQISGDARTLFPETIGGTRGICDIAIFVAGADALPSEPEAMKIAKAPPTETRNFRVVRARIRFVEKN